MRVIFATIMIFIFTSGLYATEYVKTWVNGTENSISTQGDQFAWEFDVSVNGGTGIFKLILDVDANGLYGESDVLLIEFAQTDGVEGNDGPGDSDGTADGKVYSELGSFGFAPAHYILNVKDSADQTEASITLEILPLAEPAATITGNISKTDIAPPSADLANIMIMTQLNEGFAGFWTGLTNNQGNYTINLPDTAVGTVWDIMLFSDKTDGYIVDREYNEVTINAGANTGFNFHFDLPSSYVYGKLIDDLGSDVILNDYAILTNTSSNEDFHSEIIDGRFNIPVAFEPGQNSGQFRLHLWGENLPPDYMIPEYWSNDNYLLNITDGDSIEKNITLPRTDEEIYVQILMDGASPGMAFEVQAYDDNGNTYTITDNDGWGVLSVKGTEYYSVMLRFDDEDLEPLPPGYTIEGGPHSGGVAGDTVKFNIIGATSSISGSLSFVAGDPVVEYNLDDFFVEVQEEEWTSRIRADFDESMNYRFDLADGTYGVWFNSYENDFLAIPNNYENLVLESDSLENIDFILNYRHANIYVKLKNAQAIDPTHYHWGIYTIGEPPNIYQTWANGDNDSTFHFKVCDGDWRIEPPQADTSLSLTLSVSNDGINYFVEIDYKSKEVKTGLKNQSVAAVNKFNLLQNYPNPFNPVTKIDYQLDKNSHVKLIVYDIVGREVKTLVNARQGAGNYTVTFDASRLASGVYFYKLIASTGNIQTRKMLLVK